MAFDQNSMTLIVANDLDARVGDKLKMQVAADVYTTEEMEAAMKRQAIEDQVDNEVDNEGDESSENGELPAEPDLSDAEETAKQTDDESASDNEGESEDGDSDQTDPDKDKGAEGKDEPADTKDNLDEPNAAFEHAVSAGSKELGYFYAKGADAYRKRVRKNRLATETAQMTVARRQELIRRLMYVKPADTGFTSKLRRQIQLIEDPSKVYALVDDTGIVTGQQRYEYESIVDALKAAGVEVFGTVEQLADTINELQTKLTEA